jgi:hypothetical protein
MRRTQISLSEEDYLMAKAEAKRLGLSLAEFFRRSLRPHLPAATKRPWMRHRGFVESGNASASTTIDDLVYGSRE